MLVPTKLVPSTAHSLLGVGKSMFWAMLILADVGLRFLLSEKGRKYTKMGMGMRCDLIGF